MSTPPKELLTHIQDGNERVYEAIEPSSPKSKKKKISQDGGEGNSQSSVSVVSADVSPVFKPSHTLGTFFCPFSNRSIQFET